MQINNLSFTPPTQVKNLLLSSVPFGSEYVLFCSQHDSSLQVYDVLYKVLGQDNLYHLQVSHVPSSDSYSLTEVSETDSFDGFVVSQPYYCYSSVTGKVSKEP